MRRRRPIFEDVTEMTAAAAAMHFGAHHAVGAVGRGLHRPGLRIVETRPAGAALEFLLRGKQRLIAAGAVKGAGPFLVIERAATRRLGAVRPHDLELFRREELAPLRVGMRHGILLAVHGHAARLMMTM